MATEQTVRAQLLLPPGITEVLERVEGRLTAVRRGLRNVPSSVMMGMFAPVVTDVCLTNPCTGLFSGDDLSIPGGVKPERAHTQKKEPHQEER